MAERTTHGRTESGKPITDEMVEKLAGKAEAGYDVEETLRRRGRPPHDRVGAGIAWSPSASSQSCALRWRARGARR